MNRPHTQIDVQRVHQGSSTCAYRQNEELFSKDGDFREKWGESFLQQQRKDYDDISVRLKRLSNPLEIPDDLMSDIKDYARKYGHQDSPGERGHSGDVCDQVIPSIG